MPFISIKGIKCIPYTAFVPPRGFLAYVLMFSIFYSSFKRAFSSAYQIFSLNFTNFLF